jgi:hypothetical protein
VCSRFLLRKLLVLSGLPLRLAHFRLMVHIGAEFMDGIAETLAGCHHCFKPELVFCPPGG